MKLLCDHMLGTLATWLRLCGFDTAYASANIDDAGLLDLAQKENRVLITRDKQLLHRAQTRKLTVVGLTSTDLDEQLQQVLWHIPLDPARILTRCSVCNTPLESIEKNRVKEHIPQKVLAHQETFWHCPYCNKIYWEGSHVDKIRKKIDILKKPR